MKIKPFFYNLAPNVSVQEVPKLDGLAATFIQNSFDYNDLYECCCELTSLCDYVRPSDAFNAAFQRAALRYYCTLTWRILKLLPPSVGFLQDVAARKPIDFSEQASSAELSKWRVFILSNGIRLSEASFAGWVKVSLVFCCCRNLLMTSFLLGWIDKARSERRSS